MGYTEEHRSVGAVAAKTARACDSCLRRRSRWFCEADDAFLCQTCDTSVHSANPLARRHHRVRLKTSSFPTPSSSDENMTPTWLNGLIRKPRTPRGKPGQSTSTAAKIEPLVPDLEDLSAEENHLAEEEQLLYCVPILDPALLTELGSNPRLEEADDEVKPTAVEIPEYDHVPAVDGLDGYGPASDLDLAEFASHMETLLGPGLDDDAFCIDGLGFVEEAAGDQGCGEVKVEMDLDLDLDAAYDLDFHCGAAAVTAVESGQGTKWGAILSLDYGAVITAWSSNGNCSPWMDGERPQFDLSDAWPDLFQGAVGGEGGEARGVYQHPGQISTAGEGREARVSRYREKRRTRLFSKKIRYEVRKLNAEKRPRMKGRFVKRAAPPLPIPVAMQTSALPYRRTELAL